MNTTAIVGYVGIIFGRAIDPRSYLDRSVG